MAESSSLPLNAQCLEPSCLLGISPFWQLVDLIHEKGQIRLPLPIPTYYLTIFSVVIATGSLWTSSIAQTKKPSRRWYIIWNTGDYTQPTTTAFPYSTDPPINFSVNPWQIQSWLIERVVDDLPLLSKIKKCKDCPRIYSPLCSTDNRTYTNLCYMKCRNPKAQVVNYGMCYKFIQPYIYK